MEEPPGPPLSQMARGAFLGSFLDSKNQKKLELVNWMEVQSCETKLTYS